jgi:hypothetical protein
MLVWDVQGRRNDKRDEKGLIFPEGYFLIEIYSAGKINCEASGVEMYM